MRWALPSHQPYAAFYFKKAVHHIWNAAVSRAAFLCFCLRSRCLVLLLNLSFPPCRLTAVANNWRPEPRTGPSAERPATHGVGTARLWQEKPSIGTFLWPDWAISCCAFVCRHEDGTVRFWDASGVCLHPMYKLSTAGVFHTDTDPNDNMNQSTEGEWPLFRKVRVQQSAAALQRFINTPTSLNWKLIWMATKTHWHCSTKLLFSNFVVIQIMISPSQG